MEVPKPLYAGKKAVVVGAGPAGSCAAMYLARQGFQVEVYERRPEPKNDPVDTGRAYIIILIPRGQAALKELGVELPTEGHYVTKGTVRHNKKGKVGITRESGNVTFSRSGLAQYLIEQARKKFPGQIRFFFDRPCQGVDVYKHQITFGSSGTSGSSSSSSTAGSGTAVTEQYDLLVGADGVQSVVRKALQGLYPDMGVTITDSGREYKTYKGLPGNIEPPEFQGSPGATLHLWTSDDPWTSFTAHSDPDGKYSGTFSLKTGGFADLTSPAQYEQVLRAKFVGVPEDWYPAVAAQVATESPSPAGKRIKCSRLDGPGIVLVGDAAHAVTPVFGQGANSALESCKVLGEVLQEAGGRLEAVPDMYSSKRLPDVHALNELDTKAYSFFRRRGPFDPDFLQLLSHVVVGTILSKIVPFLYGAKPALLQLGTTTPYAQITKAVARDSTATALGLAALGAWLLVRLGLTFMAGPAA